METHNINIKLTTVELFEVVRLLRHTLGKGETLPDSVPVVDDYALQRGFTKLSTAQWENHCKLLKERE